MDALHAPGEQLRRALEAELLHLLGAERRDAHFRHPEGQLGDGADLVQLVRPLVDLPVVPVEREAVHRDDVHVIEHALLLHERR